MIYFFVGVLITLVLLAWCYRWWPTHVIIRETRNLLLDRNKWTQHTWDEYLPGTTTPIRWCVMGALEHITSKLDYKSIWYQRAKFKLDRIAKREYQLKTILMVNDHRGYVSTMHALRLGVRSLRI